MRPLVEKIGQHVVQNLEQASEALTDLRRRGVTNYTDLTMLSSPDVDMPEPDQHYPEAAIPPHWAALWKGSVKD